MKIKEITLNEYGKFNTQKVIKLSENRPNLIYGKNEAGKTTLVSAITELIFGFNPINRDKHPYLPWGGERLNLSMGYLDRRGERFKVRRLLSNNVKSTLEEGLDIDNIGNAALPQADHLSKNIFNNVYRISAEQLQEIETRSFSELQDKLVLNYGNANVSPKEVLARLEEDIKTLYNPRSRGNKQRINELMDRINGLKKEKRDKESLYQEVRVMAEDIERLDKDIEAIEKTVIEKLQLKNKVSRYINPLELMEKIENLKASIPGYGTYEALDQGILSRFETLERQLGDFEKSLMEEKAYLRSKESKMAVLTEEEGRALELEDRVAGIAEVEETLRMQTDYLKQINERVAEKLTSLAEYAKEIFADPGLEIPAFNLQEIQTLFYRAREMEEVKERAWVSGIKLLAIVGLLGYGVWAQNLYGLGVLVIALILVVLDFTDQRRKRKNTAATALKEKLAGLGVQKGIAENFSMMNLKSFESIQDLQKSLKTLRENKQFLQQKFVASQEEYRASFEGLETVQDTRGLGVLLSDARTKLKLNEQLQEDLDRRRESIEKLGQRRIQAREEFEDISQKITRYGGGSLEKGKENIRQFFSVRDRVAHYERELRENHQLDDFQESLGGVDKELISEEYLRILENDLEVLGQEKLEKANRRIQLKTEIDHVISGDTLDVIDGKLLEADGQLEVLTESHDNLLLFEAVLKRADEIFREKNQPDVLKLAGEYFRRMTQGRYTHIMIEDDEKMYIKDRTGEVIGADQELSAGTKNQLYLAFRLALIQFLDQGGEKLPIILDEAFSNWDEGRLEPTLKLIQEIARERQVLIFTCKENNIRYFENYLPEMERTII